MTGAFLLALAFQSTLCAGAALLALRLLRRRSAAERSRVAHAGLLAVLLAPLLSVAAPQLKVDPPPALRAALVAVPVVDFTNVAPGAAAPSRIDSPAPPALVPLLLLAPTALLLALTLAALLRLQRLRGRARVLVDAGWLTALADTQRRFGFKSGTALLVSDELTSPVSWGLLRPVILLDPRAAADLAQAPAIVAHELAHVARLDWAKLIAARLACALCWFNPLVWMLAARCHELREEAADDAVLRGDLAGADYARLLVGVARHEQNGLLLAANGVAPRRGSLRRRVARVLDATCSRSRAGFGWTLGCALATAGIALPLGLVTLGAAPAPAALATAPAAAPEPLAKAPAAAPAPATHLSAAAADRTPAPAPAQAANLASPVLAEALIFAARKGDAASVAQLLALGVSPDIALPGDGTPLIAAARAGQRGTAQLLVERGASIDLAVRGDGNPLIAAARSGQLEMARFLLARGASVNAIVPGDGTPLAAAAAAGHRDLVRLLLARGAAADQPLEDEDTARAAAARRGHDEIVAMLEEAGATR